MFQRVRTIFFILILMFTVPVGCSSDASVEVLEDRETKEEAGSTASSREKIFVYICGQVKKPGVYEFSSGDRIVAAVKAAGGFTSEASQESINQAEKMKDGQQIYVPSRKESQEGGSGHTRESGKDSAGKVNINTAGREELMTLSGIGESKADDIIAYREEHGPFSKTEDIMKIQGIKEGIYNKIKDSITI